MTPKKPFSIKNILISYPFTTYSWDCFLCADTMVRLILGSATLAWPSGFWTCNAGSCVMRSESRCRLDRFRRMNLSPRFLDRPVAHSSLTPFLLEEGKTQWSTTASRVSDRLKRS